MESYVEKRTRESKGGDAAGCTSRDDRTIVKRQPNDEKKHCRKSRCSHCSLIVRLSRITVCKWPALSQGLLSS